MASLKDFLTIETKSRKLDKCSYWGLPIVDDLKVEPNYLRLREVKSRRDIDEILLLVGAKKVVPEVWYTSGGLPVVVPAVNGQINRLQSCRIDPALSSDKIAEILFDYIDSSTTRGNPAIAARLFDFEFPGLLGGVVDGIVLDARNLDIEVTDEITTCTLRKERQYGEDVVTYFIRHGIDKRGKPVFAEVSYTILDTGCTLEYGWESHETSRDGSIIVDEKGSMTDGHLRQIDLEDYEVLCSYHAIGEDLIEVKPNAMESKWMGKVNMAKTLTNLVAILNRNDDKDIRAIANLSYLEIQQK
jgi:hypothetical protein